MVVGCLSRSNNFILVGYYELASPALCVRSNAYCFYFFFTVCLNLLITVFCHFLSFRKAPLTMSRPLRPHPILSGRCLTSDKNPTSPVTPCAREEHRSYQSLEIILIAICLHPTVYHLYSNRPTYPDKAHPWKVSSDSKFVGRISVEFISIKERTEGYI